MLLLCAAVQSLVQFDKLCFFLLPVLSFLYFFARFLFGNEITDLPEAVFKGLSNVQVL